MTDWPLILGILSLLAAALGAVWGVGQATGAMRERIRALEDKVAKMGGEMEVMQVSLAKGDTRFAVLSESMDGMRSTLAEIKALLTSRGDGRRLHGDS